MLNNKQSIPLIWKTEIRKVSDLKIWNKNPRNIKEEALSQLINRIKERGFHSVIVIDTDNTILSGNQRKIALTKLGIKEVNVLMPNRDLFEEERVKIGIESNINDGEWNLEKLKVFGLDVLLNVNFDKIQLSKLWDSDKKFKEENFDIDKELQAIKNPKTKLGDTIRLGQNKLICGDATDSNVVKKLMGDIKVDLVNQDPPFNINLSYDKGVGGSKSKKNYGGQVNDNLSDNDYKEFIRKMMKNTLLVSKKDCHYAYWCDERYVWVFQTLYEELGIKSSRLLTWIKNNSSPTPKNAFNKCMEFICYGSTGSPHISEDFNNLNEVINYETSNGNNLHEEINNILLVKRLSSNKMEHPTEKSPLLHHKIIKRCTKIGDIVLDLTAGSGSLLIATEQLGRVAYVCEMSPIFCDLIIKRWEFLTNKRAIYEN